MQRSFQFSAVDSAICLSNGIRMAASAKHMTEDIWLEELISAELLPKDPFARSLLSGIYSGKCSISYALNQIFVFQPEVPSFYTKDYVGMGTSISS